MTSEGGFNGPPPKKPAETDFKHAWENAVISIEKESAEESERRIEELYNALFDNEIVRLLAELRLQLLPPVESTAAITEGVPAELSQSSFALWHIQHNLSGVLARANEKKAELITQLFEHVEYIQKSDPSYNILERFADVPDTEIHQQLVKDIEHVKTAKADSKPELTDMRSQRKSADSEDTSAQHDPSELETAQLRAKLYDLTSGKPMDPGRTTLRNLEWRNNQKGRTVSNARITQPVVRRLKDRLAEVDRKFNPKRYDAMGQQSSAARAEAAHEREIAEKREQNLMIEHIGPDELARSVLREVFRTIPDPKDRELFIKRRGVLMLNGIRVGPEAIGAFIRHK